MSRAKQPCVTLPAWLKENLEPRCLAPMTPQDAAALAAAVQIIELYAYHRDPSVIKAFGLVVECMQRKCQELAYHAIAHVLDWPDRERIWDEADLPSSFEPMVCNWEPGGAKR